MNIIIPAAGEGRRFSEAGYTDPKPFIAVNGLPMVVRITRNVKPRKHPSRVFWLVRSEHLDLARGLAAPEGVECLEVKGLTQGAPCTVLLAIDHINNTQPLLIANSDQLIDVPIDDFLEAMEGADGGMMVFWSDDPKWSFVRCSGNKVQEVAEKIPISHDANVGIYYFARGAYFVEAVERMIARDIRTRGEFYVAPVFNELILDGLDVRAYPILSEQMHGLGTPADLQAYLESQA